ncbi:hypothetical protein F6455_12490 [Proteobacteria bacterium 005FR1]|nr:hypothetical protein [Proteobacteria bacterium 005FR1]
MSRNPYEPPESKVSERASTPRYIYAWKAYFVFSVYAAIVSSVYVPTIKALSYFDVLDFAVSLTAVVGIYGFVYSVRIGNVVLWRYFFYLALIESMVFCLFLPLFGAERYGREFQFDLYYLVELSYVGIMLYALNMYAYKRPKIWKAKPR